mmetsp:Transcript_36747/g.59371  ORF Transcript_36747/g.59371 Transcript_36747/m.59371 type:complete len:655 (+) Transcript_36747:112-2076(+)
MALARSVSALVRCMPMSSPVLRHGLPSSNKLSALRMMGSSCLSHSSMLHTASTRTSLHSFRSLVFPSSSLAQVGILNTTRGLTSGKTKKVKKKSSMNAKWDLGIPSLLPQWKDMITEKGVLDDIIAGSTVAAVAVPLSLAIGLASGMNAVDGLNTAIVSGLICAFMGGSPLAISGPTAAMAAVVFNVIQESGLGGLFFVTFGAGVLQTITGILGIGHLIRFMPAPMVSAFATSIATLIAVGQLTRATGLGPASSPGAIAVIEHVASNMDKVVPAALLVTGTTILVNHYLPKLHKKIPATLTAVAVSSAVAAFGNLDVTLVTGIPDHLPPLSFPSLPPVDKIPFIINSAVLVYAFASLESLLSGVAVDKIVKGKPHDPSQELIGQGLGNMATALVGAVPAAGVIVRSTLNASSGAKTRRSGLAQSGAVLASILVFSKVLEMIPIPTLAGVLLSVASKMFNPKDVLHLYRVSPVEAGIFLTTVCLIIFQDMMTGIQIGVGAELAYAFYQRTDGPLFKGLSHRVSLDPAWVYGFEGAGVTKSVNLSLNGNMDFMSVFSLEELKKDLYQPLFFASGQKGALSVEARDLISTDYSGIDTFTSILADLFAQGVTISFAPDESSQELQTRVIVADRSGKLKESLKKVEAIGAPDAAVPATN